MKRIEVAPNNFGTGPVYVGVFGLSEIGAYSSRGSTKSDETSADATKYVLLGDGMSHG